MRLRGVVLELLHLWRCHPHNPALFVRSALHHIDSEEALYETYFKAKVVDLGEQDYVVKVAWTLEEACKLLEGGFQYVCDYDKGKIFRKPK